MAYAISRLKLIEKIISKINDALENEDMRIVYNIQKNTVVVQHFEDDPDDLHMEIGIDEES